MSDSGAGLPGTGHDRPEASVVVVTRNRREQLARAIRSALDQTADTEVIVIDDGSDDGTAEAVRREFPSVRLYRSDNVRGCVLQRIDGVQHARADAVIFMDDDAAFSSSDSVAQTLEDLAHPLVGAVAIPFLNTKSERTVRQCAATLDGVYVAPGYSGGASAVSKHVFTELGGYRSSLVQQNEEADYTLRLMDAGLVVRAGRAEPILHFECRAGADLAERYRYISRNEIVFAWANVPSPYLPVRLAVAAIKGLLVGSAYGYPRAALKGLVAGALACLQGQVGRRAVSRRAYRLNRRLRRSRPTTLEEIAGSLPAPTVKTRT